MALEAERQIGFAKMREYLRRLEPGEKPPPPPSWIAEFTTQSMSGLCGGLAWGGYRGLVQARSTGITDRPKERAAAFFVRGALAGGARVGGFVMLFSALALAAEHIRGARDAANYAASASTTAAAFAARAGFATAIRPVVAAGIGGGILGSMQIQLERLAGGKLFDVVSLKHLEEDREPVPVADVVSTMEEQFIEHAELLRDTAGDLGKRATSAE